MARSEHSGAPSKGLTHGLRTAGVVLLGLLAGGFVVQGLFRLLSSVVTEPTWLTASGGFLLCAVVVAAAGGLVWRRGHRWVGGSIAVGAIVWTGIVTWIVYEFSKGMSKFP